MSWAFGEATAAEWDAFVAARPDVHLLQRSAWGDLKNAFGWQAQHVLVYGVHGPVAGAQVLWRQQWKLRIGYVPRGPVWADSPDANALLIRGLKRLTRQRRAVFLRLEPNLTDDGTVSQRHTELLLAGYTPAPPLQPAASIHLNLHGEPDALFAHFSKGHRADVRRAERAGVQIRIGSDEGDLDQFYAIMQATSRRADFAIHSRDYYATAWRCFDGPTADGAARLLLAYLDGTAVAAFLVFGAGNEAQYMYSGATEVGLKCGANHLLQWHAIRWARERGCRIYDFWGIPQAFAALEHTTDPAQRQHLEAQAQASGMAGVYRFKKGFGGTVVRYVPAYDDVVLRPAYWLWQRRQRGD